MSMTLTQQRSFGRARRAASTVAPAFCARTRGFDVVTPTAVYATGLGFRLWTTGDLGNNHGSVNPMEIPATKRPAQHLPVRST